MLSSHPSRSAHPSRSESNTLTYFPYGTSKAVELQAFCDTENHRIAQRILRRLAKDIKTTHSNVKVPSAWIQRQLIRSHICGNMKTDWRQAMVWTLQFIQQTAKQQTSRRHKCAAPNASWGFIDFDAHCDLFPNHDGYKLTDLRLFINACLQSPHLSNNH